MDGRAVSRALYPKLFTLIGTVFGAGDGSTTFNIPDGRGRVAIGAGQGAGLTNRVMGAAGGQESHIITAAEMASHTHVQNAHGHSVNSLWSAGGTYAAGSTIYVFGAAGGSAYTPLTTTVTATNQNTGGDTAHNNMQPFMVWQWILKVL